MNRNRPRDRTFTARRASVQAFTLEVEPCRPEMQRAIFCGALARGVSVVEQSSPARETWIMQDACERFGAQFERKHDQLSVRGIGLQPQLRRRDVSIHCGGSALVARLFSAVAATCAGRVSLTGNATLRARVMQPLFEQLRKSGTQMRFGRRPWFLPVDLECAGLTGGDYELPGDVSSELITALLFAAPNALGPLRIRVTRPVYSRPYLRMTLRALERGGVEVRASEELDSYEVTPASYAPFTETIGGDYCAASYAICLALIARCRAVIRPLHEHSGQAEEALVPFLRGCGLRVDYPGDDTLRIDASSPQEGTREFDARDTPNLVPSLAVIGAFLPGVLRVTGARLANLHKSSRLDVMVAQLQRAGVEIASVTQDGIVDGFTVRGKDCYTGGLTLLSYEDYRVFSALYLFAMGCERTTEVSVQASAEDAAWDFVGQIERACRSPRPGSRS